MHLFVDISSHGFGHLAITAPVLNCLKEMRPDLQLTIRSKLPPRQLQQRIRAPFRLIEESSDFGYVMINSTQIDLPASAGAYRAVHAGWSARVADEARFLAHLKPDLVLTNVSYLPLAGAARAGLPGICLCSLNWADIFQHFFGDEEWAGAIHGEMLDAYRSAHLFLRPTPGMPMPALANTRGVGPIAARGKRHDLGLSGERAVIVAMGGIAHHLPVDHWPRLAGIRWLVAADWQCIHPDAIALESFGLSFTDLLRSADAIVTKPGYGMFTEATSNGTPVLYQRREDWPEQRCLIDWLEANASCREVSETALRTGDIGDHLQALWQEPAPTLPPMRGDAEAAETISALFDDL